MKRAIFLVIFTVWIGYQAFNAVNKAHASYQQKIETIMNEVK